VESGQLDRILCSEAGLLGVKPELGIKGARLSGRQMGDANASDSHPGPRAWPAMFAAYGQQLAPSCLTFLSQGASTDDLPRKTGPEAALRCPWCTAAISARQDICANNSALPRWRVGTRSDLRGASATANCFSPCEPADVAADWPSATSCSEFRQGGAIRLATGTGYAR